MRYRKKPVVIDAMQWDGTVAGATPIIDWVLSGGGTARYLDAAGYGVIPDHIAIDTIEGTMRAAAGWWIIRGVAGEHYPCDPDIFEQTYEFAGAAGDES